MELAASLWRRIAAPTAVDWGIGLIDILLDAPGSELIWASPREILNVVQADQIGCHIITLTQDLLAKLETLGKDLDQFSLETVQMFRRDALAAGLSL